MISEVPVIRPSGEGEAIWYANNRMTVKASAESTGGAYGLVEAWLPAGEGPPLHIHHREDEAFWVLEGDFSLCCGERTFSAGPGAYVFLPREVPHGFVVEGNAPGRLLVLLVPGGSERYFIEAGRPAEAEGLPPAGPLDFELLERVAGKFGMEFVGPPLTPRTGQ